MFVIRDAQLAVFAEDRLRRFAERAEAHLRRVLPDRCRELGDDAVRASVQKAIAKAGAYGLESEYEILTYLNVMHILGFAFDEDPQYSRAREALTDRDTQAHARAQLLMQLALEEISG
jgi:hypothetical protein